MAKQIEALATVAKTAESRAAWDYRRHVTWFVAFGVSSELLLIIFTRYLQRLHRFNYFTEGTFFTWFSSMQLAAIALTAVANAYVARLADRSTTASKAFYGWLCAGAFAFFLAIDEWFEVHESVAPLSGRLLESMGLYVKSSYWDLVLFSVYALVALVVWRLFAEDLYRSETAKTYLLLGFLFVLIGVILDTAGSGRFLVMWEDSFMLLGFFFFWTSFVSSLLHRLNRVFMDL